MKKILLFFTLLSLSGCASLGKLITPNTILISQIVIDAAVGAACGPDTLAGQAKAQAIKTVASELLAVDKGSTTPLMQLEVTIAAKLAALNLNPGYAGAVTGLLGVVDSMVANVLQNAGGKAPTVAPGATVAIAAVLQQVINATAVYGV